MVNFAEGNNASLFPVSHGLRRTPKTCRIS
jgi:hypothetical protein